MLELVVGLMSLCLGALAIWLSIKLYRMSEAGANRMVDAQAEIQRSVEHLDRLFGQMYSDTWALVRDSYQTMHERLWEQTRAHSEEPEVRRGPAAPRTTDGSPPVHPPRQPPTEETIASAERSAVDGAILEAYRRLSQSRPVVRAGDLADAARRDGYSSAMALNALYDLTIVQRRLLLAGNRFIPESIVAESAEGLQRSPRAGRDDRE